MDTLTEIIIEMLIIFPLITIIHEIGHVIPVLLYGGKITNIKLGQGKKIINIGCIQINRFYFYGGSFSYKEFEEKNRFREIMIMFSGPLLNLLTGILFFYIGVMSRNLVLFYSLIKLSILSFFFNLLPLSFRFGNTDGMQILQLIKFGRSHRSKAILASETTSNTTSAQRSTSE